MPPTATARTRRGTPTGARSRPATHFGRTGRTRTDRTLRTSNPAVVPGLQTCGAHDEQDGGRQEPEADRGSETTAASETSTAAAIANGSQFVGLIVKSERVRSS